jgi:hypothetical protein
MVLLQAAMSGGFVLIIFLISFIVIFTLVMTCLLMKLFWRILKKEAYINLKKPYYKDPLPFIDNIILSSSFLVFAFYLRIFWFNKDFPNYGYYN